MGERHQTREILHRRRARKRLVYVLPRRTPDDVDRRRIEPVGHQLFAPSLALGEAAGYFPDSSASSPQNVAMAF